MMLSLCLALNCLIIDVCVCLQWFRSAVIKENAMPEGLMTLLFSNIDPIYEFHRGFLKEIDQRLALWYLSFSFITM